MFHLEMAAIAGVASGLWAACLGEGGGRAAPTPDASVGCQYKGTMFLIAGVQPKTKQVDDNPQRCPACGLTQAYTTRVDHYLSLFFIPLLRVKQGEPFLLCQRCQRPVDGFQTSPSQPSSGTDRICVACKQTVDSSFKYCPHCGQRA